MLETLIELQLDGCRQRLECLLLGTTVTQQIELKTTCDPSAAIFVEDDPQGDVEEPTGLFMYTLSRCAALRLLSSSSSACTVYCVPVLKINPAWMNDRESVGYGSGESPRSSFTRAATPPRYEQSPPHRARQVFPAPGDLPVAAPTDGSPPYLPFSRGTARMGFVGDDPSLALNQYRSPWPRKPPPS